MDFRPVFSLNGLYTFAVLLAIVVLFSILAFSPSNLPASGPFFDDQAKKYKSFSDTPDTPLAFDSKKQKLDASAQMLIKANSRGRTSFLSKKSHLSIYKNASGRLMVDLFVQLNDPSALGILLARGIEIRTQVGDIIVARAPVAALSALAEEPAVRRVEISKKRQAKLDSSRADIGADMVHLGTDLPQAYQGEGVVIGVIDSGIDFTHPDFSDQNGSRIQFLLEFTEGGGQNEWTKSDIDNDPASVTQKDGNGDGGHGTHVTGIATGGGQLNAVMTGIAPAAAIIFVKGIRDPDSDGGFIDTDVIAGCQYIFDKADQMEKPAVINLSLGSHFGPHDGTSLYEQALSGLVGPGKIIVVAAGNEGDDFIHAGGTSTADVLNETIVIADSSNQREVISMWYDSGVIVAVVVFAYDAQFNFLGQAPSIGVGSSLESTPVVVNNDTLGFVTIDALTTQDPNNGDGNVLFVIENNDIPTIDISDVIWAVGSRGDSDGRVDLWVVTAGKFYDQVVGFPGETEMPGNNDYSVGPPANAEKVISVGAYVTKNRWASEDGNTYFRLDPDPNNPGNTIQPEIGQIYNYSSRGPTRDGRISPDITAPGDVIFSAISSDLTEGVGYGITRLMPGGGYLGKNGTSFASPHVAGTIALMLQVKRDLNYDEAVQCLAETARMNQFTGTTPNNDVGAGYLDAHAAVIKVGDLVSSVERTDEALPESFVLKQNYPNPFNPSTNIEYSITTDARAVLRIYNVAGQQIKTLVNETQKAGTYTIQWDGTNDTGQHVASGIYYLKFRAGQLAQTGKMVLMR